MRSTESVSSARMHHVTALSGSSTSASGALPKEGRGTGVAKATLHSAQSPLAVPGGIVAVAPLIIIWVRDPVGAMVVCAALVALFPIISNTTLGLRSVDPDLQSYFKLNRATRLQTLIRLRIPSALPYFFGGLRISSGLSLIGAVVAEFVAGTGGTGAGLAYQILQAGFQLDIPRMFAALVLISFTGVALFVLMAWLTRRHLGGWHASEISRD